MIRLKDAVSACLAITCSSVLAKPAIALPPFLPSTQRLETTARVKPDAPLCYIQFQGSSAIDVSNVCGKKPGEPSASTSAVAVSSASAPPIFDPKVMNASTTGQCNFIDANGNPCPQK